MKFPEKYRIAGEKGESGQFVWKHHLHFCIFCQASNDMGWEHVSVSIKKVTGNKISGEANRCPTWQEMCIVKYKFWSDEETVMQLHPPISEYISTHPYVLHLWKPIDKEIPRPEGILIGYKGDNKQKF